MINADKRGVAVENKLIMMAMRRGDKPFTQKKVEHTRSMMIQGNYPASMTDCEVIGISGGCGHDCIVLQRGDCKVVEEGIENGTLTREEAIEIGYDLT